MEVATGENGNFVIFKMTGQLIKELWTSFPTKTTKIRFEISKFLGKIKFHFYVNSYFSAMKLIIVFQMRMVLKKML